MQQVKFFSQQLVALHVVDELLGPQLELRLSVGVLGWGAERTCYWMAATAWLSFITTLVRESLKVYSLTEWLPFEVEKSLDRLDLNPPRSSLHSFSD